MTPALVIAFVISFVVGPMLCGLLLQLPKRLWVLAGMAAAVVALSVLALRLRVQMPLASVSALWLGWVCAVAMVGLAVLRRAPSPRVARWARIMAGLATTLPWFGLAVAQLAG